jgi:tetratricopeptide (TPR) repeat protein
VYEKRGEYVQALTSVMLGTSLLTPDRAQSVELARLLTLQCRVHHQQGQFEEAIEAGERALAVVEDTPHYQEIAQAHNQLGNAYIRNNKSNTAIQHLERGLAILERIGDEHGASKIYNNLAILHSEADLQLSLQYMRQVLNTMQRLGDTWGESTAYQNLGIVHYTLGDYPSAVSCYERSLSIKEQLNDTAGIADCHINLGEVYRTQRDLPRAIEHLQKGLVIARKVGSNQAEAECLRQLAQSYLEHGHLEQAVEVSQEALQRAQAIGDQKEEGIIERVLGNVYLQLNEPRTALSHLEESVSIMRGLERDFDLATALYDYGRALRAARIPGQALQALQEALHLFEKLQLTAEIAAVRNLQQEISTETGQ